MNEKKRRRQCRRKVIPLHFQKRNNTSLSQCLQAASSQRRIRELLQNNRALASELEVTQNIASSNRSMLQKYARDSNQILLAKLKLKSMASTIQKLVGDLNEVLTCLDETDSTGLKGAFADDLRMRIQAPTLSDIEESVRSSYERSNDAENINDQRSSDENEESPIKKEIDGSPFFQIDPLLAKTNNNSQLFLKGKSRKPETMASSNSFFDSSLTEIYNVQQFLSNENKPKSSLDTGEANTNNIVETESPPTPQFNLPKREQAYRSLADSLDNYHSLENNKELASVIKQNSACSNKSKIPIRQPDLFHGKSQSPGSPIAPSFENRRETFVIKSNLDCDQNDCLFSSGRRETFTIKEISEESHSRNKQLCSQEDIFKQPLLPALILKPTELSTLQPVPLINNLSDKLTSLHQGRSDFCSDDQTKLISEDMELTEIIPSAAVSAFAYCTNNDANFTSGNFVNPQGMKISEMKKKSPVLKNYSPISPIEKINARSDLMKNVDVCSGLSKLEAPLNKIKKFQNSNEKENTMETENCLEQFCKSSKTRSSMKSILSQVNDSPQKLPEQPKLVSDVMLSDAGDLNIETNHALPSKQLEPVNCSNPNDNNENNFQLSPSPPVMNNIAVKKSLRRVSKIKSKKSIVAKDDTEFNCSISDPVSSDSEPDFIITVPKQQARPRIPSRKSLQKNRRRPYTFKTVAHGRKSSVHAEKIEIDVLTDPNVKTYDFSSASDEDIAQEPKTSKKYSKKKTKVSKNKIDKSTVANLERDINLQYQINCRNKRSLKRRVSFADMQSIPANSDEENNSKINEDHIPNSNAKAYITRPSILKKTKACNLDEKEESPCSDASVSKEVEVNETQSTFKSTSDLKECHDVLSKTDELLLVKNAKKSVGLEIGKEISKSTDERKKSASEQKIAKRSNKICAKDLPNERDINKIDNSKNNNQSVFLKNSDCNNSNSIPDFPEKALLEVANTSQSEPSAPFLIKPFKEREESSSNAAQKSSSLSSKEKEIPKKRSSSRKHSEFLGLASKRSTRGKRTFSGVSERSSKRRFTGDDDFLENMNDVEINPQENKNLQDDFEFEKAVEINRLTADHTTTGNEIYMTVPQNFVADELRNGVEEENKFSSVANVALSEIQNTPVDKLKIINKYDKTELALSVPKKLETKVEEKDKPVRKSKPKKRTNAKSPKKRSNSKTKIEIHSDPKLSSINNKENKPKSLSNDCLNTSITFPATKLSAAKSSIQKGNYEDTEEISERRSRRGKVTSYKEPTLNSKMRRE